MRRIPAPTYDYSDVFDECISNFRSPHETLSFQNIKASMMAAGVTFTQLIAQQRLYTYPTSHTVGPLSKVTVNKLYKEKLSKAGHSARIYYDGLKSLAPNQRCPLCAVRTVTTLDHYLPKGDHPIFTVFPLNLVPACKDCNTDKLAIIPTRHGEETLHPYYDDVDGDQWLKASVEQTNPISFSYSIDRPAWWNDDLYDRVETHLRVFKLYSLYSFHAAEELSNISRTLRKVAASGTRVDLEDHLTDAYESRLEQQHNSWQTAMYRAMANNVWFQDQFIV